MLGAWQVSFACALVLDLGSLHVCHRRFVFFFFLFFLFLLLFLFPRSRPVSHFCAVCPQEDRVLDESDVRSGGKRNGGKDLG